MEIRPIILAGGSGTRLWPLSRTSFPKQFLALVGERTLYQETICRLDGVEGVEDPIIVGNQLQQHLVVGQSSEVGKTLALVILEPIGRNTAPALTLAALALRDQVVDSGPDPVMLIMPSDHLIRDVHAFQRAARAGAHLAERGYLVTFGIVPDHPATGYGYIKKGLPLSESTGEDALLVSAFLEKPGHDDARSYVESGDYFWNSGMFMMRVSVWLKELGRHRPDIVETCRASYDDGVLEGTFLRPEARRFEACPSESIDYAVMEKASVQPGKDAEEQGSARCAVVPLYAGWSDLGDWYAVWEQGIRDESGNVAKGDVYLESVSDSLLVSRGRLLAGVGLDGMVVVETDDSVLVAHKDRAQGVKDIVGRLKRERRPEGDVHPEIIRPWGSTAVLAGGPDPLIVRLKVTPGSVAPFQTQSALTKHLIVVKGRAIITRGDERLTLNANESALVPPGVEHQVENAGKAPLEIIELRLKGPSDGARGPV